MVLELFTFTRAHGCPKQRLHFPASFAARPVERGSSDQRGGSRHPPAGFQKLSFRCGACGLCCLFFTLSSILPPRMECGCWCLELGGQSLLRWGNEKERNWAPNHMKCHQRQINLHSVKITDVAVDLIIVVILAGIPQKWCVSFSARGTWCWLSPCWWWLLLITWLMLSGQPSPLWSKYFPLCNSAVPYRELLWF